jgi:hypothetical protein
VIAWTMQKPMPRLAPVTRMILLDMFASNDIGGIEVKESLLKMLSDWAFMLQNLISDAMAGAPNSPSVVPDFSGKRSDRRAGRPVDAADTKSSLPS